MKKTLIALSFIAMGTLAIQSCKQEPKMPSEEEIAQKVTDKYGAELNTLKDLRKMECEATINQKVSEKLAADAAAATPAATK